MPDVPYSELANWDGRLSAPGSVDGDELPSGSSPRPRSASPRIDPAHSRLSHTLVSITMVAEKSGVTPPPNLLAERTERGAGSSSEKDAVRQRTSPRHLDPLPPSSAESVPVPTIDNTEQQVPCRTQLSPSRTQARPISTQKPASRHSRPVLRSPTLDKRQRSRSHPPAQDDDADSLMDADGETDHESVASVYPIQNNAESSSATTNVSKRLPQPVSYLKSISDSISQQTSTRDSTEATIPSLQPYPHAPESDSPPRITTPPAIPAPPAVPTTSAETMSIGGRKSPAHNDLSNPPLSIGSSPLTSPGTPLRLLPRSSLLPTTSPVPGPSSTSHHQPTKKRRLNRAYVEVPPLPPWRRRASYRRASEIFELQQHASEKDEDVDMGGDYAAGLGAALNNAAAFNGRDVSMSPAMASSRGRPMRASRTRARESLVRESPSTRGASVNTSASNRRGRPPGSRNNVKRLKSAVSAEEPALERKSGRRAMAQEDETSKEKSKGKGKERAQDVKLLPLEAEEGGHSDDNIGEEKEPHLPADNLESFLPSVRIHIGTYPQTADGSSVWPPRSEQSAAPVIRPAIPSPAISPSAQRPVPAPASVPRPPSSSSVPSTITKASQPIKPLPRRSHLRQIAPRPAHGISASSASSLSGTAKEPSVQPSEASSSAQAPRTPLHAPPAASPQATSTATAVPTQTIHSPPSQPPPKLSQPNLSLPPPIPHPPSSDARTDSQQSFDFSALLADFDAHPAPSSLSTSPSQSQYDSTQVPSRLHQQPSFPTGVPPGTMPPSPPGGFRTLQHILTHFAASHKPVPPGGDPQRDVQQDAQTMAPHMTPPTPGDKFLRAVGYGNGTQCGSFFPWVLDDSAEQHTDAGGHGGTIDPSLLGGPQPEARPPSMSPQGSPSHSQSQSHGAGPVAGPSRIPDAEPSLGVSSQSSLQAHSPETPLDSASDSDADSDPGADMPLSMKLQRQFPALSKDLPAVEVEGRRPRRLTERALAMRHTLEIDLSDEDAEEFSRGSASPEKSKKGAGKGKGKGKAKDTGKAQAKNGVGKGRGKGKEKAGGAEAPQDAMSIRELAGQPTFCHQCRKMTPREKMRCSTIRDSGDTCGLRYCSRCIELRYPDVVFEPFARHFVCPRCRDTCNCTHCCGKRGETYISARVGKLPTANSVEALALIKAKATEENNASTRVVPRRIVTPPPPAFDLVPGQFFGDSQRVVFNSQESMEKATGVARVTVRRKRRPRFGKPVAYIGQRRVPYATPVPSPASSVVSQDPQEVDAHVGNDQSALAPVGAPQVPENARPITPLPRRRMYIGDRSVLDKGT
ncbi:hypothetical protein LXA43DRAFT_1028391, partial [Ganoderma leucocontextum]